MDIGIHIKLHVHVSYGFGNGVKLFEAEGIRKFDIFIFLSCHNIYLRPGGLAFSFFGRQTENF